MGKSLNSELMATLLQHYGAQRWWPARTRFEVIVGAFLVQNTAWTNAEQALRRLRAAGKLTPAGIRNTPLRELEELVRPSGYFRQKAARLKTFADFLERSYGGSLTRMFARPTAELRRELRALPGVGEETADAILLYAGGHEAFVVDAYARRVAERHGLSSGKYGDLQRHYVEALAGIEARLGELGDHAPRHAASRMSRRRLPAKARLYAEAHAVLVRVGNEFCKRTPECSACPLKAWLPVQPGESRVKLAETG